MARPQNERRVRAQEFAATLWKPAGVPGRDLEHVVLTLDQVEALFLADAQGLYQEAAARKMGVSRQTFGRIVAEARRKVAHALINGKALKIEGGQVLLIEDDPMHNTIALPTRNGNIDSHLGHCESFTVITFADGVELTREAIPAPDGCGCKSDIISRLAEKGVTLVIASHMGDGALRVMNAKGIEVIRGVSGPVDEAVAAYLSGKLTDQEVGCPDEGCS